MDVALIVQIAVYVAVMVIIILGIARAMGSRPPRPPESRLREQPPAKPTTAIEYSQEETPLVAGVLPDTPELFSLATSLQNILIAGSAAGPVVVKPTRLSAAELTASKAKELDLLLVLAGEALGEAVQRSIEATVETDRTVLLFITEPGQDEAVPTTPLPTKVRKSSLTEDADFTEFVQLAITDELIRDHIRYRLSERQVLELIAANERLRPPRSGPSDPPSLPPDWGFELVEIPAGWFIMGGHQLEADPLSPPPGRWVYLDRYYINRFPVTCAQYGHFFDAGGYLDALGPDRPKYWTQTGSDYVRNVHLEEWGGPHPALWDWAKERPNYAMVAVTWYEATAYCRWLGDQADQKVQLPTEAQWEKAARGTDGRKYPWGNEFDSSKCSAGESDSLDPCVGEHSPEGDSPYGVADMRGNVLEWTSSLWRPYPYDSGDGREDPEGDAPRVLRGSSAGPFPGEFAFVSQRIGPHPGHCEDIIGFRFVVIPSEAR